MSTDEREMKLVLSVEKTTQVVEVADCTDCPFFAERQSVICSWDPDNIIPSFSRMPEACPLRTAPITVMRMES